MYREAGKVDAGGCFEDCRDSAWSSPRAKNAGTRVLTYTADIPGEMIVVRRGLDAATKKKLAAAILALNNETGILTQISQGETTTVSAVVAATTADLNAVSTAIERVAKKKTR